MDFRDYTEIVFAGGDILSAQMLEETYRYPREFLHVYHAASGDGIIAGLDFLTKSDGVYLTAGIVKRAGRYYILPQDVNMDEWVKQQKPPLQPAIEYFLYMVDEAAEVSDGDIASCSRLTLKAERSKRDHALLLAKYKYRPDLSIRLPALKEGSAGKTVEEFTQASFLQLLDCAYAHPQGEATYHPLLFRAIRSCLEKKELLSPYDFSLLLEIQNHGIAAISTLEAYVAVNKKAASSPMTREKLFHAVIECAQMIYQPAVSHEPTPEQTRSSKERIKNKLI